MSAAQRALINLDDEAPHTKNWRYTHAWFYNVVEIAVFLKTYELQSFYLDILIVEINENLYILTYFENVFKHNDFVLIYNYFVLIDSSTQWMSHSLISPISSPIVSIHVNRRIIICIHDYCLIIYPYPTFPQTTSPGTRQNRPGDAKAQIPDALQFRATAESRSGLDGDVFGAGGRFS